jgi:hypothetical protein
MARHWIFRTDTVLASGGFNPQYAQAWQFEFITRLIEQKGIQFAGHLPEPFVSAHPPVMVNPTRRGCHSDATSASSWLP